MRRLTEQCSNITLNDIIRQLDKATDMLNALSETVRNLSKLSGLNTVKEEIKNLENKVIAQGDMIAKLIADDYGDCKIDKE